MTRRRREPGRIEPNGPEHAIHEVNVDPHRTTGGIMDAGGRA
jgi:hypothetical protein